MSKNKSKLVLQTVDHFNYTMLFSGKMRTFEKVTLTISPFDGKEAISVKEINRLSEIVRHEVLSSPHPLLIGEVQTLKSLYQVSLEEMINQGLVDLNHLRRWHYEWDFLLPLDLSLKIKNYFNSQVLPKDN